MKSKILFIDDEPCVLEGYQRVLRPHRTSWELDFCGSGAQALEQMKRAPYDIVVADMRMNGMSGSQLLAEVKRLYPKTVRIILSGYADKELILKCAGTTHQYLTKPCEPEILCNVLERMTARESSPEQERIKELAANLSELPTVPALYTELVATLNQAGSSLADVGQLIKRDPGMTATLLKLVNSAFFGLRRQVSSPTEAVGYLGIETIKSLVLAGGVFEQYNSTRLHGFSLAALWSHSLETAACARLIARTESVGPPIADEAFVGGLLHDVGKLILAVNFGEQYVQAQVNAARPGGDPIAAERAAFGATHPALGSHLLDLWGLPVPVVEAIAMHHQPWAVEAGSFTALTAIHIANLLVQQAPFSRSTTEYLVRLGLVQRLPVWREAYLASTTPTL